MTMNNRNPDPSKPSLLEFPCRFPIKAMGRRDDDFETLVTGIIRAHADFWPDESVRVAYSNAGNYVSVTAVVDAQSQEQLDAIYQELTDCPDVLMAL